MVLSLQGCATGIALSAMNGFGACSPETFKKSQYMKSAAYTLQKGESKFSVLAKLGKPIKERVFRTKSGEHAEVLLFNFHAEYCRNYDDQDTYVVLKDGNVEGVGEDFYRSVRVSAVY